MTDDHDLHETDAEYMGIWAIWAETERKFREQHGIPDQMREIERLAADQYRTWATRNAEALRHMFSQPTGLWTQRDWDNWYAIAPRNNGNPIE